MDKKSYKNLVDNIFMLYDMHITVNEFLAEYVLTGNQVAELSKRLEECQKKCIVDKEKSKEDFKQMFIKLREGDND